MQNEIKNLNKSKKEQTPIEELLFKKEMSKRQKHNYFWKDYISKLLSNSKLQYTEEDKELIKQLLFNHLPSKYRKTFWLIASNAKYQMLNNKGYYQKLLEIYPKTIPFPFEKTINYDLKRTFPQKTFFQDENNLQKLKNILMAFAYRNITIGYSQGFNFIAAKILLVIQNEEESFWVFTNILENYLPIDFYLKFTGVKVDMQVIKNLINSTLKYSKNDETIDIILNNLLTKCFISLFSQSFQDCISNIIWDAFFIYGNIILYKAFIWVVYNLFDQKMKNFTIENIHNELIQKIENLDNIYTLNYFLLLMNRITDENIKHNKNKIYDKTIKENSFPSFENLKNIQCDKSLPFCIKNRDIDNIYKYNQFIILKTNKSLNIINDYFFNESKNCQENKENDLNKNNNLTINDLLIERQKHYC
jgi:hypothetical protein